MRLERFGIALLLLSFVDCKASLQAEVNAKKKEEASFDEPPPTVDESSEKTADTMEAAMLGARHDVRLEPKGLAPVCSCLAVAVGASNDQRFQWEGEIPRIDTANQVVLVLESEGVACEGAGAAGPASYWGYVREGDDIVVHVETAQLGRPIPHGAIVPRPGPDGAIYVRPASKKTPFGRPLVQGDELCRVL